MRLFLKTFAPVLLWLGVLLLLLNQLVFGRLGHELEEWASESERQVAVVLARAIAVDLHADRVDQVRSVLDTVWGSRPDIALIELQDASGTLLYPKVATQPPKGFSRVSAPVEFQRRRVGTLVLHVEQGQIQATIRHAVARHVWWVVAMGAGTAALIAISQVLLVLRPVRRLRARVAAWRAGAPAGQSPRYPSDEIGDLGREFERTREQLRRRDAEVLRSRVESEQLLTEAAEMRIQAEAGKAAQRANQAKSDFLATMSHEIRTPLNGVIGMADLLSRAELNQDARRQVNTLRASAESLLVILNDILDFSKIEAGRLELESIPFNLPDTLQAAADIVQPQADAKGLVLTLDVDDLPSPWVLGDPTRLRQVVLNLLTNAIKFTSTGHVRLTARRLESTGSEHLTLRCAVEDTGIGIPPDRIDRLFQSFSQVDASTSRRFGGTGLGLAICQKLVSLMGGAGLTVRSVVGRGSEFAFVLTWPLAAEVPEESAAPTSWRELTAEGRPGDGWRVLVAEDDTTNQYLAKEILSQLGCEVDIVGDGQAAVDAALASDYDLVLMDLHMPVMDGLEAATQIRARSPDATRPWIAALTASAMAEEKERFKAAGVHDFLTKPIRVDEILWLLQRVPPPSRLLPRDEGPLEESSLSATPTALSGRPDGTAADVLTPQVLDRYRDMLGPAFVKQLARTWLETSPTLAETVISALQSGRLEDARRAAHTLKSASATLGAHALASLCQQIEEDTAADQVTKEWGVQRLDAFGQAWSLTVPAVTKLTDAD